jgi:hypothetical protein
MIIDVYIIRKGNDKFLSIADDGNWAWVKNQDDASIYKTEQEALNIIAQKQFVGDVYTYQIPYSTLKTRATKKRNIITKRKKKCRCK